MRKAMSPFGQYLESAIKRAKAARIAEPAATSKMSARASYPVRVPKQRDAAKAAKGEVSPNLGRPRTSAKPKIKLPDFSHLLRAKNIPTQREASAPVVATADAIIHAGRVRRGEASNFLHLTCSAEQAEAHRTAAAIVAAGKKARGEI